MNKRETTKYEKLIEDWIKTGEDMIKAQGESVEYGRKFDKMENPTTAQKKKDKKLIDAGFKAEAKAFKKAGEYDEYVEKLKKSINHSNLKVFHSV
jgi:hypothetical protein